MLTAAELDRLVVVLVESRNPLNIGAAARAMSNFGCLRLRVVQPYEVAFRNAVSAVDAEPVLLAAEEFASVAEAIADCSLAVGTTGGAGRETQEPLLRLESAAEAIREQLRGGGRVALLFGSEKRGLSNQDLAHCRLLLRIPTRTEHPSMNLGQSVAVVLYELIRESGGPGAPSPAEVLAATEVLAGTEVLPATEGERERLIAVLLEGLSASGYVRRVPAAVLEDKLRRLVRHQELTSAEVSEWLGLYRQLLWGIRHQPAEPAGD